MMAQARLTMAHEHDDSEHFSCLETILNRLETLVRDYELLVQAGALIKERRPVDVASLATESWQAIGQDNASLSIESEIVVRADPSRLQQVLENLFWNAMDHGPTDVTIRLGLLDQASGFFVADNGSGISSEDRKRVLQPGHTTTATGTGYGLAIVTEIAEAHEWTIQVKSDPTGGARFEFHHVELVES